MSALGEVIAERHDHVLLLTLNRPERLNAITWEMQQILKDHFAGAQQNAAIRVIVMTGAGRAFCSGADVMSLQQSAVGAHSGWSTGRVVGWTARQANLTKPTICAVNGVCAGAGLHFVADSDIVIASETASFVDTHVDVGQVTALEPIGLLQKMPLAAVLRMVILGRAGRLTAHQALCCRMLSEVTQPAMLMRRAMELAHIAAQALPMAVGPSLQLIWRSLELRRAGAQSEE
jgi:enoyl-CoA hydratase/carnithine racemase